MPAFAFGACTEEFAGDTGLRKGLNVAVWAVACSLPAWFLRSDSLASAAGIALALVLFYAVLGLSAGRRRLGAF